MPYRDIGSRLTSEADSVEPVLDPNLPIVDAHHHLWVMPDSSVRAMESRDTIAARALATVFRKHPRYLLDELLADLNSGHNVRATVYNEAGAMYRARGPVELRSVGEVEFVNGVAAMTASGLFGDVRACAGIVGGVDLALGNTVEPVLRAHLQAGGARYKGVRSGAFYDDDPSIAGCTVPHRLLDPKFREGFRWLRRLGLSFDAWLLEPQLPELVDLARAFPDTQIILNHVGAPAGVGRYEGQREARFPIWRENMRTLSRCENVAVKLGGFGIPFWGFSSFMASPPATSTQLAEEWKPYIETCIELFGAHRCMFESNYPVDSTTCSYRVMWNAYKRVVAGASQDEKTALFSGTAIHIYRLDT